MQAACALTAAAMHVTSARQTMELVGLHAAIHLQRQALRRLVRTPLLKRAADSRWALGTCRARLDSFRVPAGAVLRLTCMLCRCSVLPEAWRKEPLSAASPSQVSLPGHGGPLDMIIIGQSG